MRTLFLMAVCFLLQGCLSPAIVMKADEQTTKKALALEIESDRARIYYINGIIEDSLAKSKLWYPSDFIINGETVGSKNKDDVLVIDLKPGKYDLSWKGRSSDPIDKNAVPEVLTVNLNGGEILILQGNLKLGASQFFGLIGGLAAPQKTSLVASDKSELKGKSIVLPQNCSPSLCLKQK